MNRRTLLAASLLAPVGAALAYRFVGGGQSLAQDADAFANQPELPEIVIGDPDAPVRLTEYASMTCPHCRTFHRDVLPEIKARYLDTGRASYALREFPFDPRAMAAFMLARCAPERHYHATIDLLFEQQDEWSRAENAVGALWDAVRIAGFSREEFEACLNDGELQRKITAIQARGQNKFGVNAVPAMFVDGERLEGPLTVDAVAAAIEDADR